RLAGAGRGVRPLPLRQRRGLRLRPAPETAALRRLPGQPAVHPNPAPGILRTAGRHEGSRRMSPSNAPERYYNYAYLDEQTKRMIRRSILKALAIPGYQVPFGSREMPVPYGWGTGGIQLTAAIIGPEDVYKCIDQGADDTTNAVSIRRFFAKVADV